MTLSNYHQKYSDLPDIEITSRANEKKAELVEIFKSVKVDLSNEVLRVAVLGCGDKRFVKCHEDMFKDLCGKPVEITTFDISIDHLSGEKNVIQHDCTLPIPNAPYDITFAHVLLKFIETEKQWDVIKNSVEALGSGGIAIHVMDKEDYETKEAYLPSGQFAVPLERWKHEIEKLGLKYYEILVKYGLALVIQK